MKHAVIVGKSLVVIVAGVFLPDLLHVPASGGVIDKLIFTKPVVFAIRISMIIVAFGVVDLVVVVFWKEIGIVKIGSSGVEFGKLDKISNKTESELAAKEAKIRGLEAQIELLKEERRKLQELAKAMVATRRTQKDE